MEYSDIFLNFDIDYCEATHPPYFSIIVKELHPPFSIIMKELHPPFLDYYEVNTLVTAFSSFHPWLLTLNM